jgi:hypothetical protein
VSIRKLKGTQTSINDFAALFNDGSALLGIGGILIGDIYSKDLLDANFSTNAAFFTHQKR